MCFLFVFTENKHPPHKPKDLLYRGKMADKILCCRKMTNSANCQTLSPVLSYIHRTKKGGNTMALPRLLIADNSEEFCAALAEALSDRYAVSCCHDGETVLSLFRECPFDTLVINLMLPEEDGLSVVEKLRLENFSVKVLALTPFWMHYIQESVERLSIGYVIMKPCKVSTVVSRLIDLDQPRHTGLPTRDMYAYLSQVLIAFPMKPTWLGFKLLRAAILLSVRNPNMSATKELYPAAAKLCGKTDCNVERNLRTALDGAWASEDHTLWLQYFPPSDKRPEPSDFIARLAQDLRLKQSKGLLDPYDFSDY